MGRLKFFVIYVWIEFIIFPNWFVSAKPITHSNHNKFTRTSIEYNLQNLGDDSLLTTDVDLEHNKDHARITNKDKNDHKLQLSLPVEPEKQEMSAGYKPKYRTHRFRHNNSQKGKNDNIIGNSRVVVNRKSREDDSSDDFQDDDHIRSKDEDDEDDVQLIIIPRKPHKRLRPKVQDEEDDRKTTGESDSKDLDEVKDNSEDSLNSDDSDNTQVDSENILNKKPHRHKESDDGETLSVERVAADEDEKGSDKTAGKLGDYDLHVKVKDKSGTNVKLSGDLPGNIGNLVAEGEGGGRVQVENNKNKANLKLGPQDVKDGSNEEDASTDDIAQNLIKMKSGKLKHAPYPSTILLKPSPSDQDPLLNGADDSSITSAETSNVNQEISLLKSKGNDKYSSDEVSTSVLKSPSEQSVREANNNDQTDKRPGSNVFSSMEFENGDDELMATSRLLDIARKVDDESSLKDVKDSSNSRPPSSPSGSSGKQRSTTSSKPVKLAPEDYRKQSDQIDKESNDNWYKLQSLQDEIVKEGSSAKPGDIAPSTMVLPDDSIHGTRRHHFEVHDMSDVFGGKWKAVHIPDEQISSMLETAHRRNGSGYSLDIEHENPEKGTDVESIKVPVKIHGRVHAFEHDALLNNSKNSSRSIGNLIVAMENEVRGKETRPLHNAGHKVLNLREKTKEIQEEPTTREIAARNPRRPSVVVAKIPDDDESDEELPLREMHDPIVASLRKTPPKDGGGAMRSDIQERVRSRYSANFARKTLGEQTSGSWLNKIIAQVRLPSVPALLTKTLTKTREGVMRSKVLPKVASPSDTQSTTTVPQATPGHPTGGSSVSEKVSNNKEHISEKTKNVDVLEKIKSLLLKPHSKSEDAPMVKTVDKAAVTPLVLKTAGKSEGKPLAVHPEKDVSSHRNSDGLFLPKPGSQQDAFSNHAAALNRISSAKKEALLLGIIKALLSRGRSKLGPNAMNINAMPHYDKQAVLQGIQSLQMQKTFGNAQKNGAAAGIDTGDPGSVKGLEEFYEKQREQQVRQELARANEESEEARRASLQEGSMLSNYDRFSNPEAQNNFNNMNPEHSETINGQVISLMGPQQLTMVADNPTATK